MIFNALCWLCIFTLSAVLLIGVSSFFFEGTNELSELISLLILSSIGIGFFYWVGPYQNQKKKNKLKKIQEIANKKEEAAKRKEEAEKKAAKRKEEAKKRKEEAEKKKKRQDKRNEYLKTLATDEVWSSYKNNKICLGMHIELVLELKGTKYDEKRTVTKGKIIEKYKFGRTKNLRGNWKYDLEVSFENNIVVAFKDL